MLGQTEIQRHSGQEILNICDEYGITTSLQQLTMYITLETTEVRELKQSSF